MGKRYYCDYCDRSFKDDAIARKKHLLSLQHVKNRAEHYSAFKDPEEILKEESTKTPCKRYMTTGDCAFGHSCKFSHYTPPMIWELQRLVAMKTEAKSCFVPGNKWPDPDTVIKEYFTDIVDSRCSEDSNYLLRNTSLETHLYQSLPPSLWPITPESITDSNFNKWGL